MDSSSATKVPSRKEGRSKTYLSLSDVAVPCRRQLHSLGEWLFIGGRMEMGDFPGKERQTQHRGIVKISAQKWQRVWNVQNE